MGSACAILSISSIQPRHREGHRTCVMRRRDSLDQAVALLAAEAGEARVLAGGTDLLVQMRTDVIDPVLLVDIKGIAETAADQGGGRRLSRRRRRDGRRAQGARQAQGGLAGRGRGRQPDRLHPGPGPRHHGRQPVQRLAGRRQRAGADRRRRQGRPSSAPTGRREVPVEDIMLAPRKLALAKGEIIASFLLPAEAGAHRATPTCASSRAPRWTSPWSAAASA